MPLLSSLPEDASLADLRKHYDILDLLKPYAQQLMRGPDVLTPAQREMVAAYVSALNSCQYCHGAHSQVAIGMGIDENLFDALMMDVENAPIEDEFKPILQFARKLTEQPHRMTQSDADAVYRAGWPEAALFSTIAICAYFNNMNRLVQGAGIIGSPETYAISAQRLIDNGYQGSGSINHPTRQP